MYTYTKIFAHADSKCQSSYWLVVQKRLGMKKFVRTKSPTGNTFSKIFFEQLYTGCIVDVSVFLCGVIWRHNRAPNLEPRFLVNFVPV